MTQSERKIHSDTLSVGEMLRKPFAYRVPVYQRDFAWTSEEVDVLWDDLISAIDDHRGEYFLGTIVTSQGKDNKTQEIVDGQQRIAALCMMFAAIADVWRSLNHERRALGVVHDFLGSEDRKSGEVIAKLSLNETNDLVFRELVLEGRSFSSNEKKAWPSSNKLLEGAFRRIQGKVKAWAAESGDTEAALFELEDFVANHTNVILIEVGDESDAFVIFETLNDRGLELAVADLVKNYLFSLAGSHNIERFKRAWADTVILVGSENLTPFLRHYWLSERALVRERDLYRGIRGEIRNATAARQFIERLRKVAEFYAALLNFENTYWSDFPAEARNYLEALLLFKVTQYRPVVLAAMETKKPDEVTRLLRMLMVVSFRYTVVSSLGTGNLEKVYTDTALGIRKGEARNLKAIFGLLKPAYVDDGRFVEDFTGKSFTKAGIARYILAEVNAHLEKDAEKTVALQTGRVTLEHILPKNPGSGWKGSIPQGEEIGDYVDLIGNLTLLESGKNKGIGVGEFPEKVSKGFSKSSLVLNNELSKYSTWTSKEISQRSKCLASVAKHIWRVDF